MVSTALCLRNDITETKTEEREGREKKVRKKGREMREEEKRQEQDRKLKVFHRLISNI